MWVVAVNQEDPSIQNEFPEAIPIRSHNQPPDTYFFGEVQDSIYVTIRAPRTSWDDLRVNSFQAWVDLTDLPPDIHNMDVHVKCSDLAVRIVSKRPSKIAIRLETLAEKQFEVKAK